MSTNQKSDGRFVYQRGRIWWPYHRSFWKKPETSTYSHHCCPRSRTSWTSLWSLQESRPRLRWEIRKGEDVGRIRETMMKYTVNSLSLFLDLEQHEAQAAKPQGTSWAENRPKPNLSSLLVFTINLHNFTFSLSVRGWGKKGDRWRSNDKGDVCSSYLL